jgi:hypothetical protein
MSRKNQFRGTLSIDWPNLGDIGTFDTRSGGGRGGTSNPYRPGGMGSEIQLGAQPKNDDITITRLYQTDRDHLILPLLYAAAGKAKCHYHESPLDAEGTQFDGARGKTITYNGVFMKVDPPERDSMSEDGAMLTITIAVEGTPG